MKVEIDDILAVVFFIVGMMFLGLALVQHLFDDAVFTTAVNGIFAIAFFMLVLVVRE